jgi:hypothetical protein
VNSVKPATLSDVAAAVGRAQEAGMLAWSLAPSDPQRTREFLAKAKTECETAILFLRSMGAEPPTIGGMVAGPADLPLRLLDTEASREYLAALEAAAAAGERLDRERGWIDAQGEAVGHGETLAGMALAMRTEIFGPAGKE